MPRRTRILFLAAALLLLAGILAGVGYHDTTRVGVAVNTERVRGIASELRILHVADLHAARFGAGQADIERALAGTRFDAAVITGDLLVLRGGDRKPAFELVDVLKRHTDALLYVPGNHDDAALGDELAARGVVVLGPGSAARLGRGDTRATIVYADRNGRIDTSVASDTGLLIVAMHQPPDAPTLAAARRITTGTQVFLAGHTHGGQIRLPLIGAVRAPARWDFGPIIGGAADEWFPDLRGRQVMGVYRISDQVVEITPGLGTTGVRLRLFDPAQLTVLRLLPLR